MRRTARCAPPKNMASPLSLTPVPNAEEGRRDLREVLQENPYRRTPTFKPPTPRHFQIAPDNGRLWTFVSWVLWSRALRSYQQVRCVRSSSLATALLMQMAWYRLQDRGFADTDLAELAPSLNLAVTIETIVFRRKIATATPLRTAPHLRPACHSSKSPPRTGRSEN